MRRVDRGRRTCRPRWPPDRARRPSAFGDGSVYLEREIVPARHIEVQLLGDATGRVVAIGERDCSLQRRHQKLVEEAPAPGLIGGRAARPPRDGGPGRDRRRPPERRDRRVPARRRTAPFWFLEVNTRLQVEHGVTELVTGLDIVREQFWLAAGRPLSDGALGRRRAGRRADSGTRSRSGSRPRTRPATSPRRPGRVRRWVMPAGPGVRVDTGDRGRRPGPARLRQPDRQDHGPRRRTARAAIDASPPGARRDRDRRASRRPCRSTGSWPGSPAFAGAELSTDWVEEHWDGPRVAEPPASRCSRPGSPPSRAAAAIGGRRRRQLGGQGRRLAPGSPEPPSTGGRLSRRPAGTIPADAATGGRGDRPRRRRPRPSGSPSVDARPPADAGRPACRRPGRTCLGGAADRAATRDQVVIVDGEPRQLRSSGSTRSTRSSSRAADPARTPVLPARRWTGRPGGRREVVVDGWRFEVEVEDPSAARRSASAPVGAARRPSHGGPTEVRAIIPGRVVVGRRSSPGDAVAAGQQLLVVEAMKMQNELRAPRDGIVDAGRRRRPARRSSSATSWWSSR